MRQNASVMAAIFMLYLTGVLHGLWTDRWQPALDLGGAVARLGQLSLAIGPWRGRIQEIDERDVAQAGYAGCLWRCYDNAVTKDSVSVLLVCGRPGPVSVHTPDVCYRGAGYEMDGEPERCTVACPSLSQPASFWKARFVAHGPVPRQPLSIYWSWHAASTWAAPSNPRLEFARQQVLFKLYVIAEASPAQKGRDQDLCSALLREILPELTKVVSPPAPAEPASAQTAPVAAPRQGPSASPTAERDG